LAWIVWIEGAIIDDHAVDPALDRGAEAVRAGDKFAAGLSLIARLAEALEAGRLQQGHSPLATDQCGGPGCCSAQQSLERIASGGEQETGNGVEA
jgi:hypothetical protein